MHHATVPGPVVSKGGVPTLGHRPSDVTAVADKSAAGSISTSDRRLLGSMNDFVRLAGYYRADGEAEDLLALSVHMAETPCGPLFETHVSPDKAVRAVLDQP